MNTEWNSASLQTDRYLPIYTADVAFEDRVKASDRQHHFLFGLSPLRASVSEVTGKPSTSVFSILTNHRSAFGLHHTRVRVGVLGDVTNKHPAITNIETCPLRCVKIDLTSSGLQNHRHHSYCYMVGQNSHFHDHANTYESKAFVAPMHCLTND